MFYHFLFAIFFIISIQSCECWYRFGVTSCTNETSNKTNKENETIEIINMNDLKENECQNHADSYCGQFKYTYNPHSVKIRRKKTLSACLKCALCISVTKVIMQLFDELHDKECYDPQYEEEVLKSNFNKDLCRKSFLNHDLRRTKNEMVSIETYSIYTEHVKSNFDGEWPKLLRDMCCSFVDNIETPSIFDVYAAYHTENANPLDFFCRNSGVFRECTNIEFVVPDDESESKVKKKSFFLGCF